MRDRALLLVGFFGAFTRSELAGLDVNAKLSEGATGYIEMRERVAVRFVRSKTDQVGEGQSIGIPRRRDDLCPVRALEVWLAVAGITSGPIFRGVSQVGIVYDTRMTPLTVNRIVRNFWALPSARFPFLLAL
jgi:hypothetical protein